MTDHPTVNLGGTDFPIPPLAILQLRTVFPALGKIVRVMGAVNPMAALAALDEEGFGLILDTVFVGVAHGSPGFTRGQFDQLVATPDEIFNALTVVGKAAGLKMEKKEAAVGGPAGEGGATSRSTGTDSSLESLQGRDGPGTTSSET